MIAEAGDALEQLRQPVIFDGGANPRVGLPSFARQLCVRPQPAFQHRLLRARQLHRAQQGQSLLAEQIRQPAQRASLGIVVLIEQRVNLVLHLRVQHRQPGPVAQVVLHRSRGRRRRVGDRQELGPQQLGQHPRIDRIGLDARLGDQPRLERMRQHHFGDAILQDVEEVPPVVTRFQRDLGGLIEAAEILPQCDRLAGQPAAANQLPLLIEHRGHTILLVDVESDVVHERLLLLVACTPTCLREALLAHSFMVSTP